MNRELSIDSAIEDFICRKFVMPILGESCPACPLGSLCRSYVNEELTFEDSSDWNCCKYYDPRKGLAQELCPHYISRKDGLEILRRTRSGMRFYYCEEAKAWPDKEAEE